MRMVLVTWAWVMAAGAILTGGCGGKEGGQAPGQAKTPKQAILNMVKAIETGNKGGYLAAVSVPAKGEKAAGVMFDTMSMMLGFKKDLEKAYGKEAVAKGEMVWPTDLPTAEEIESKVKVTESGDTGKAEMPDGSPLSLVRKGGVWKVDLSEGMPPPEELGQIEKAEKDVAAMKGAIAQARGHIGKEGYTAEKIMKEFAAAMMKSAMGGMSE